MRDKVFNIKGASIGVTPKKGTKYVRLLCETDTNGDLYQTLWLTEKTEENSIKSLVEYGYAGDGIDSIWHAGDFSEAAGLFTVRDGGVEVEVETETYTEKATGEEKSITKISHIIGFKNIAPKMDKKELPKFKSSNVILRKMRGEQAANAAVNDAVKTFEEDGSFV